jgi:Uncharacterised BCR, YnfA/UPF0060 family
MAARTSRATASGRNSSAQASSADPIAASAPVPKVKAAAPPIRGTAQHAAHAAPMPRTAFQGFITDAFDAGAQRPQTHDRTSSGLRVKRYLENSTMDVFKTFLLFVVTALAEILGCYLAYLWLKQDRSRILAVDDLHAYGSSIIPLTLNHG